MDDFARAVEDGLKLSKRLALTGGSAQPPPPPRPPITITMERSATSSPTHSLVSTAAYERRQLLPSSPSAYAVVVDPGAVDSPDVPSYQPHVYGRLDPPALIPLQMKEIEMEVEVALDVAMVCVRARWWVHCITRSRACDCRIVVPMGEQGSIRGVEVNVGRRSYATQVVEAEGQSMEKIAKSEDSLLKPQLFSLTISEVGGGEDIFAVITWSQKLLYDNGRFSVDIPFRFPYYVNPLPKMFVKKEKIQLTVNNGTGKELLLQGTSHPLKEKSRQGGKLSFFYEAAVENWSKKDFLFSFSVYSGDLSGSVLLQPPRISDYDQRDMFCIFLLPGTSQSRKIFRKSVVFVVDTSASMQGKPLESVKNAVSACLSDLVQGDYFNIIAFNDELHLFSRCLEPANEKTVENAIHWMNFNFVANGGTDIMHPLSEAIGLLSGIHGSLPQIFLITDGSVDDERSICHTMRTQLKIKGSISPRISTFGLGSYCNHYFLRMLASVGKGHYDAVFDSDSIESRMLKWFQKASSTIVANVTVDAFNYLEEFEVYSEQFPDISTGGPVCVSGRYQGKFPENLKVKGCLADMNEVVIELKVHTTKDIPLDKVLAKQHVDLLTALAWLSEDKQLEKKVIMLSIQSNVPSEYTNMVLLQKNLEKVEPVQKVKQKSKRNTAPDERLPTLIRGLTLGFGDITATKENLPTGFGEAKPPETFEMFNKAAGCCSSLLNCCCCMCCIKTCSKMNDQCAIVLAQLCTALSCLACFECCSEVCCAAAREQ